MPRTSTQTRFKGSEAAIRAAKSAKGFTKAPSSQKGRKKGHSGYGPDDLEAAKNGDLSEYMKSVFSGDSKLDEGVELVSEDHEDILRAKEEAQEFADRQDMGPRGDRNRVLVTKNGSVQVRNEKGQVVKVFKSANRDKSGKFGGDGKTVVRVTDEEAFKEAAERRAEALGTGFLRFGKYTEARRVAILSGLQRDREARGWKGVPDLV